MQVDVILIRANSRVSMVSFKEIINFINIPLINVQQAVPKAVPSRDDMEPLSPWLIQEPWHDIQSPERSFQKLVISIIQLSLPASTVSSTEIDRPIISPDRNALILADSFPAWISPSTNRLHATTIWLRNDLVLKSAFCSRTDELKTSAERLQVHDSFRVHGPNKTSTSTTPILSRVS